VKFIPNRKFKKQYDRVFRRDPVAANLLLLLAELADEKGQVMTDEQELSRLMPLRFSDPHEYALGRPII